MSTEAQDKFAAAVEAATGEKMLARGYTREQIAAYYKSTPTPTADNSMADSYRRTAEHQFNSMGIKPVTTEEAATIQLRTAARMAANKPDLDTPLADLRAQRSAYLADPLAGIEVIMDAATGKMTSRDRHAEQMRKFDEQEARIMEERLRNGLPAEPTVKSPAEIAQERFAANSKPKG